jgi:hypothetical protein
MKPKRAAVAASEAVARAAMPMEEDIKEDLV